MPHHITVAEARAALMTRVQLDESGMRDSDLRRATQAGVWVRVQRNQYAEASLLSNLWPESKHLVAVVAASREMRGGESAISHYSAAVVHGLPLYRLQPARVQSTLLGHARSSSRGGAMRHEDTLGEDDVTTVGGIRCTTLERTVFDIARTLGWEATVACADAALRTIAMREREYDPDVAAEWRDRLRERAAGATGRRGIRQARRMIEFADGRAELPGESVSRVQLVRLGFTDLDLQVAVPSPAGRNYEVDIGIQQARTFWEFDGKGKYADADSIRDVVLREKQREDWIRGKTQWRMVRGEDAHIVTPAALAKRLASFGVYPPR
ncbi:MULTISPECIES: hypothetical protein [unclassified Microbacterium]|uniref:hypothetical protein n=1 Tax=unclassified Microbacterium TaxID=2609290 RepID=UPI0037470227